MNATDFARARLASGDSAGDPVRQAPVLVYIGHVPWDAVWGTWQHLASRLSRFFRVLYVDPPVSVASPIRDWRRALRLVRRRRRIGDDLAVLAPLAMPPQTSPLLRGRNAASLARQVQAALKGLGWQELSIIMADHAYSWRLRDRFPDALFCVHVTGEPYWNTADSFGEFYKTLDTADVAVTLSPPLEARLVSLGLPTLLLDEGVDADGIRLAGSEPEPADLAEIGRPRVCYIGAVAHRLDTEAIERVARARPDVEFVFIGARGSTSLNKDLAPALADGLAARANVHVLGPRDQARLGAYLAYMDVGWVPYTWVSYNHTSNPLKVMEYLAAGLPVVANAFEGLAHLESLVTLVPEGGDFLPAIDRALEGVSGSRRYGAQVGDTAVRARVEFAHANSWATRAEEAAQFLQAHLRRHRSCPRTRGTSGDETTIGLGHTPEPDAGDADISSGPTIGTAAAPPAGTAAAPPPVSG